MFEKSLQHKGIAHPKWKFINHLLSLKLFQTVMSMSLFWTLKKIFCRIGNQTYVGLSGFYSVEENAVEFNGTRNCLVTHTLQNNVFCVPDRK